MSKKLLFVDCETTGLPVSYDAPFTDTYNWPRIIQLAWCLTWDDGTPIDAWGGLIKPDGWVVPEGEFWQKHGYSTEKCEKEGTPATEVYDQLVKTVRKADVLVAHNLGYDLPIIRCEFVRYGIRPGKILEKFCTKLETTDICQIPGYKGRYKWPTLDEAYQFFFGVPFEGAHDALQDVAACMDVYFALQDYKKLV